MFVGADMASPASLSGEIAESRTIRVLTVDDSALIRLILNQYLNRSPDIEVVGQAADGNQLLAMLPHTQPDLIVLDIEMPVMNGLEALRRLMQQQPLPVIILSNLTWTNAEVTLRALELGAVDFVLKPQAGVTMAQTANILIHKIRAAVTGQTTLAMPTLEPSGPEPVQDKEGVQSPFGEVEPLRSTDRIVALASSTGGPRALTDFFKALPAGLPIGGVIVQHMPSGFTLILSQRLHRISSYVVREAVNGERIQRGQFLVAPGGFHLRFDREGRVALSDEAPVNGVRPAADVTLQNLADLYGSRVVSVVLTGMGKDGYSGALQVYRAGGTVLAQSEESCVVYGMPRLIIENHLTSQTGSPAQLGRLVEQAGL